MKLWFQLVSSPKRLPLFLDALRAQTSVVAGPDTEVVVSGTTEGALGDHYALFLHLDAHEIIRLARRQISGGEYDVYALANSLDPGLDALRELLDIPVLSLMQVGCSVACMIGDRFGVVVPNSKFIPAYQSIVEHHGFGSRLSGVRAMNFDHIASLDAMFGDETVAKRTVESFSSSAAELVAEGAEVVMAPGPVSCLLHRMGITEIAGGVKILDLYSTLVKVSEGVGYLAAHCGMTTSRRRKYQQPSPELIAEATRLHDL